MLSTPRSVTASLAFVAFLAACSTTPPPQAPKPAGPVTMPAPVAPVYVPEQPAPQQPVQPPAPTPLMTPTTFSALPGWEQDDLRQAWPALLQSCRGLNGKADWKAVCAAARALDASDGTAVRRFFETWFV
ncbi:MAG: murein transglycosylase, partial [Lysobacteraceae bacterium]